MLLSFSLIFLLGIGFGAIFNKLKLPSLLGMLVVGIILSPNFLNILDEKIMSISPELRKIALVIILTRAGLNLNFQELKKIGHPAVFMCFLPALFEILATLFLGQKFLGLSILDSLILGTVIAAASPGIIIPKMLNIMNEKYGIKKGIPQLLMACASVDNVFVIILFTAFTGLATNGHIEPLNFLRIPSSIVFGLLAGKLIGKILLLLFKKFSIRDSLKVLIMLNISFLLFTIESRSNINSIPWFSFSGLLAIMTIGTMIKQENIILADRLSLKFTKLWLGAEIILFVLVGATINLKSALHLGITGVIFIFTVLAFRLFGVFLSTIGSGFNKKERLFCMIGYSPKATVQAVIGSIPLALGLSCGDTVLTMAILAILFTAPIGAFVIDYSYRKLLEK